MNIQLFVAKGSTSWYYSLWDGISSHVVSTDESNVRLSYNYL